MSQTNVLGSWAPVKRCATASAVRTCSSKRNAWSTRDVFHRASRSNRCSLLCFNKIYNNASGHVINPVICCLNICHNLHSGRRSATSTAHSSSPNHRQRLSASLPRWRQDGQRLRHAYSGSAARALQVVGGWKDLAQRRRNVGQERRSECGYKFAPCLIQKDSRGCVRSRPFQALCFTTWHILIGHIVRGVVNYWTVYLSVPSESHLLAFALESPSRPRNSVNRLNKSSRRDSCKGGMTYVLVFFLFRFLIGLGLYVPKVRSLSMSTHSSDTCIMRANEGNEHEARSYVYERR